MATTNIYYTVVRGDNLTKIARRYGTTWQQIYSWNRSTIGSNPNLIYPGQRLIVGSQTTTTSSSGGTTTTTNKTPVTVSAPQISNAGTVSITNFGVQADNENTAFVKWSWSKTSTTKNYQVQWQYRTKDGIWFIGSDGTTEHRESTYSIPSYATHVSVAIKPVSETRTINNQQTVYWTSNWSSWKTYTVIQKEDPPATPSTPTVEIDAFKLTADLDNIASDCTRIQFEIVKNNSYTFKTATVYVVKQAASYSCTINPGGRYKVRARAIRGSDYSEWSNYSSDVGTIPSTPSGIVTMRAEDKDQIYLSWNKVDNTNSYDIEYALDKKYFDKSGETQTATGITTTSYLLTGLTSGNTYYARIRAVNDEGHSGWSDIKSCVIGTTPIAPTTWSSSNSVIVGEKLYLYWVHNSEDGSTEKSATIQIWVDGVLEEHIQPNKQYYDEDHKDDTKFYEINTNSIKYRDGSVIEWRVKTAGITMEWGPYSVTRTVNIYAQPELNLSIENKKGTKLSTIESFPFFIKGIAGPANQTPVSYHVSILANESYETTDRIGNKMHISQGDEVFSKYYDSNEDILLLELTPYLVDLENNISYTVIGTVSMNSGLTVSETVEFNVAWTDIAYMPSAEITIDRDSITTYIRPYCTHTPIKRQMLVEKIGQSTGEDKEYVPTGLTDQNADDVINAEIVPDAYYRDVENPYTFDWQDDDGTQHSETSDRIYAVYSGLNSEGTRKYYYEYIGEEELVDNITLSVYRREFDGTFTEIGTNLNNKKNTFITDPHPALDYARYRIIAIDNITGAISYSDTPAYPVHEIAVIIQWDEKWVNFDVTDSNGEELQEKPWTGSLLRLPYNIDVSNKNTYDLELVSYAGRKHPVSYYGTHVGESATWNLEIPKEDKETLYAIRRLAKWLDDVYVREPSGTGYWAAINVSYSQTHNEVIIPVTFDIVRVEGGM